MSSSAQPLTDWLHAVLETPGLTALRDPAEARRVLVDDSLRAVPLLAGLGDPVVDVGSGGGAPGIPLALELPDREFVLLEAQRRKCRFLEQWAPPNARVLCGRAEEQGVDWAGAAVAKALAPPPVAAEWCLPLVRPGGAVVLFVGETADIEAVARVSAHSAAASPKTTAGCCSFPRSSDASRLSTPPRHGPQAAAGLNPAGCPGGAGRPTAKKQCSGGLPDLRAREPEGRGRQDDDRGQPRRLPGRGGRESARHRPRPAGERDLGARRARQRHSSYDLLDGAPLRILVKPTRFPNLDLVPSKPDLAGAVVELARRDDGERFLARSLAGVDDGYSFVFLDCPPSLGPLTVNALAAADRVLVPVQAEYYALEGLTQLLRSVELVRQRLNPQLALAGVLLTMVDRRTKLAAQVEQEVRQHLGDLVFETTVPRSVRLAEAPSHGLPAIAYDRSSPGAEAYWKVAMELVERA